jgi:hypothetical protein
MLTQGVQAYSTSGSIYRRQCSNPIQQVVAVIIGGNKGCFHDNRTWNWGGTGGWKLLGRPREEQLSARVSVETTLYRGATQLLRKRSFKEDNS